MADFSGGNLFLGKVFLVHISKLVDSESIGLISLGIVLIDSLKILSEYFGSSLVLSLASVRLSVLGNEVDKLNV